MFTRKQGLKYGAGASLAALGVNASAAVPAGVEAVFTGLATDFGTIMGYGYTAMGIILGGLIILGLVKRVARKATS